MSDKTKGYIKEGEVMFVSVRFPTLSLVIDAGGDVQIGERVVNRKPRYVDFFPGFAGGEFRVNKVTAKRAGLSVEDLLAHLRERDNIDDDFCEVKDSDHLALLVAERERVVKDDGDGRPQIKGGREVEASAPVAAPASTEPSVPQAAKTPGRRPKGAPVAA